MEPITRKSGILFEVKGTMTVQVNNGTIQGTKAIVFRLNGSAYC